MDNNTLALPVTAQGLVALATAVLEQSLRDASRKQPFGSDEGVFTWASILGLSRRRTAELLARARAGQRPARRRIASRTTAKKRSLVNAKGER